jgi:hypothetical protein
MPSAANGQESNTMENVKMLKTLTAIGISAAIAFAPLAAIAQTDTTAPAGAPAATDTMAPAKDSMKAHHHKAHKSSSAKMKKPAEEAPAEAPKS